MPIRLVRHDAFDERAAGVVVRFDPILSHLMEVSPSFIRIATSDANIDERVIGHVVWSQIEL